MDITVVPTFLIKLIPGALGSLFSMLWLKDSVIRMATMFLGGIAISYYGTSYCIKVTSLDPGIAGFLLGLFGMSIISSCFDTWKRLRLPSMLREWIRALLRLPPEKDTIT